MAQERFDALFRRLKPLDVSDDRFRRCLFPMLDHSRLTEERERERLAKEIIALANTGGGGIFIGFDDEAPSV